MGLKRLFIVVVPGEWGMKKCGERARFVASVILFFLWINGGAQNDCLNRFRFFKEESLAEMTIAADFRKLVNNKNSETYKTDHYPAVFTLRCDDHSIVNQAAEIRPRGQYRREECDIPPIMVNFKVDNASLLKKMGRMKLVWPCGMTDYNEQLIFKEYLVYKIYNLITSKSFRVRLVKLKCFGFYKKEKEWNTVGFFIEDVDDVAKRNNCTELQELTYYTEQIDRQEATLLAVFEYMIGNTDWAVPIYRNVRLIRSLEMENAAPYAVPYDFDYCGLVNAKYAVPPPELGIYSVRERLYRGFARTTDELEAVFGEFRSKRLKIHELIMTFPNLSSVNKREMVGYLDEFFETISNKKKVDEIFIKKARQH